MADGFAYFIMVHHKPAQFEWLMRAIYDPDDLFLVHVDLKSRLGLKADRRGLMAEVRRICADKPNVVLMPSRFTNWGGWSLSRILLDAIALALRTDSRWTRFINLSGQCYPLKPTSTIRRELGAADGQVHLELSPLSELDPADWHGAAHWMLETPARAIKLPISRRPPRDFQLSHKGSQWVILPRHFCEWIAQSPLTGRISRYLRHRLLSDELLIQTLLINSPYLADAAPHYGRAILWPGPKILTMGDLPWLRASPAWFARKFDGAKDAEIMTTLAERIGARPGPGFATAAEP